MVSRSRPGSEGSGEVYEGAWAAAVQAAQEEVLVVTHRFDPAGFGVGAPGPVTVRFSGRRQTVIGTPDSSDRFAHEEVVEAVAAGAGPISVTARISHLNPGRWDVDAEVRSGGRSYQAPPSGEMAALVWLRRGRE